MRLALRRHAKRIRGGVMAGLGELLTQHSSELVNRWYRRWLVEGPAMPGISEAAIKDHLGVQLCVIGDALRQGRSVESPRQLWQDPSRSDPEQRFRDYIPIEEVVREYGFVLDELRNWIAEQPQEFSFEEISFLFLAIFELAAESARRYAKFAASEITRERSNYVAGLAHQMRTPVSTLRLSLQKIGRERGGVTPAELQRLNRTVDRLARLVDSVGRIERFGPEEMPVHPASVRPAEVIDALLADYEHEAIRKGLRLEVVVNRSASMLIDPDLLVDALGNLVQNAIKYTQHGYVRIVVNDRADEVDFRIEDSGPGIAEDRRQQLFRPVIPGMPGGMGLGLTIAQRAAQAQGGTITVSSALGQGSTFVLRLPREVGERNAKLAEV